jgi:hypothetical protein
MVDLRDYFLQTARMSRRALSQFLCLARTELDDIADDLELGDRLSLEKRKS